MTQSFSFDDADRWLQGAAEGYVRCVLCGPGRKAVHQKQECLRLNRQYDPERILYFCWHCQESGIVTRGFGQRDYQPAARAPPPATGLDKGQQRQQWASELWRLSQPAKGTLVEAYWQFRELRLPVPPTIRFHPRMKAKDDRFYPALIAAAGLPILDGDEWFAPGVVDGVQRIFLKPDGHGKADLDPVKMSLGSISGKPIVVHCNPESLALVIGEGIEKTHALAAEQNVDGWAVTGKSFFRSIGPVIPSYVETVTIIYDADAEKEEQELGALLEERGIEVMYIRMLEAAYVRG